MRVGPLSPSVSVLRILISAPLTTASFLPPCSFSSWSVGWLLYIPLSSFVSRIQPGRLYIHHPHLSAQSTTGRVMLSVCGCADEARPLSITHRYRSVRCCAACDRSNRGDHQLVHVVVGGGGGSGTVSIQPSPFTAASSTWHHSSNTWRHL